MDPIAGKREQINRGEIETLTWPDVGQGCPVEQGQIFKLRTCSIEITRTHRTRERGVWIWRAWLRRSFPEDTIYLLGHGAGADGSGYVHDEEQAIRAQDDPDASTIASVDPQDNPANLREPPEPEAVPPDQVGTFTGDRDARQRYLLDMAERRAAHEEEPLAVRLAKLQVLARDEHVDISSEIRVIERRLEAMERKVLDREAA